MFFSLKYETGHYQTGYAVASLNETIEASPMPWVTSAQHAEL